MLAVHRFDPQPCGFPKPAVDVLPRLRWNSLRWRAADLDPRARWFSRGRYALAAAYRLCHLHRGGVLLAPAYHCRTMLDPAVAMGAEVRLYPLQRDLSPDLPGIAQALAGLVAGRPRALLFPHYFGFIQPLAELAALCRTSAAPLIEDCSHVLAAGRADDAAAPSYGATGTYAVASPYKFFPTGEDGGLLWSRSEPLDSVVPAPAPRSRQVKQGFKLLGDALADLGTPELAAVQAPDGTPAESAIPAREWFEPGLTVSMNYVDTDAELGAMTSTKWIVRHTDLDALATRRRANYQLWLDCVRARASCRALYPALLPQSVPYMFPLVIDQPERDFYTLKRMGLPIWRWDEQVDSSCGVARDYRLKLLHLPCHQSLTPQQMHWMTSCVAEVCA